MKNPVLVAFAAALATVCSFSAVARGEEATTAINTPVTPKAGKLLYSQEDGALGVIQRVMAEGAVLVIHEGKMFAIPANTLSDMDGKLATTFTKRDLRRRTKRNVR